MKYLIRIGWLPLMIVLEVFLVMFFISLCIHALYEWVVKP